MAFRGSNCAAVKRTNDSCTVSKWSVVDCGYHTDPILTSFVDAKCKRRASLINRCYCVRSVCVDRIFNLFFQTLEDVAYRGIIQIAMLGAGFDSSFWRLCQRFPAYSFRFIEFDFPDVCRRKCSLVRSAGQMNDFEVLEDTEKFFLLQHSIGSDTLFMSVGCDMTDALAFPKVLNRVIHRNLPTLVLSEVVFVYMKMQDRINIIRHVIDVVDNNDLVVFMTYEQLASSNSDAFSRTMLQSFQQQQSPLLSYFCSLDEANSFWTDILRQKDKQILIQTCADIFYSLHPKERLYLCNLEPAFDEFEPYHLKCSSYFVALSMYGQRASQFTTNVLNFLHTQKHPLQPQPTSALLGNYLRPSSLRCYGFSMCSMRLGGSHQMAFLGGFGYQKESAVVHSRFQSMALFRPATGDILPVRLDKIDRSFCDRMYATLTCMADDSGHLFVFGGRQSPLCAVASYGILSLRKHDDSFVADSNYIAYLGCNPNAVEPKPRFRHVACSVNINGEVFFFIHGGRLVDEKKTDGVQHVFGDVWLFAADSHAWYHCSFSANFPKGRHSHAVSCTDSLIYLMGGLDSIEMPLGDLWRIAIDRDEKIGMPSYMVSAQEIHTVPSLEPRYGHDASIFGTMFIIIGGVCPFAKPFCTPDIVVVDLPTTTARFFSLQPGPSAESPFMFTSHRADVVSDENGDYLAVVGGGANCFSFGTHFNSSFLCIPLTALIT